MSHLPLASRGSFAAQQVICLAILTLVSPSLSAEPGSGPFVWPGNGIAGQTPVWGHREGLRIGLHPTPGPAGLIRIYSPYLDQDFPRVVNFLSIEPTVMGQTGRDQSELALSRDRPGERGLTSWASNTDDQRSTPEQQVTGRLIEGGQALRLFIHTEPFPNGARPVIECRFHQGKPFEVELITHVDAKSEPLSSCTLSATMGNYGQLRRIHLANSRVVSARNLWSRETPGRLGFLSWHSWPADQLQQMADGRYHVQLSTDVANPASVEYDPKVADHWKYVGRKAMHYWRTEGDAHPRAAVNGRRTYWMSQAPIPGGSCFENFELAMPFKPGRRLWFGVLPDVELHQ